MLISKFAPNFILTINEQEKLFEFSDSDNGFLSVYNYDDVAKTASDGYIIQPHCGHVINPGDSLLPIQFALNIETNLSRLTGKASTLMSGDWHQSRSSHTTGGGDRFYISVGGERHLRGFTDGLQSLRSRATDQEQRPVAWWPFEFKYAPDAANAYYGSLAANGWKYDDAMLNGVQDQQNGWDIFDPAHLESATLFFGAALGDRQCLANFFMLAAWVYSTFPGGGPKAQFVQKGWHGSNQERARGWRYWFDARAIALGLDTGDEETINTFYAGQSPKKHAVAILKDALANPQPIGPDKPDDRTMVDFKDGSNKIAGSYGWANGIMFGGWGYLRRIGVINEPLKSLMDNWMITRANDVIFRSVGDKGLSYSYSTSTDLDQADCDKANQLETDKSHVYELVPLGNGTGVIRDKPRKSDAELMAGGLALLFSYDHPTVQTLLAVCDKIGSTAYNDRARYLDVAYGQVL